MSIATAESTVALSVALALGATACGSSPNGPPVGAAGLAGSDAGGSAGADAGEADATGAAGEAGITVDAGPNCPTSFTARSEGASCFKVTAACDYPEGRCGCLVCEVGTEGFGYVWSCRRWDSGGAGCPARAPALGSPCASAAEECRYGAYCSVPVGDDLVCQDGTWQPATPADPCGYRMCPS